MSPKVLDPAVTAEDLLNLPDSVAYELIDGNLVEKNVSVLSSRVEILVATALEEFCQSTKRGQCWPGSLGYRIFPWDPDQVVRPDASFISADRLSNEVFADGFMKLVPDLAVEVLSKHDLAYAVDEKIEQYLRVGVKLLWIINPETRTVMIHRVDGTTTKLHEADLLEGENVVVGFQMPVAKLFPKP